MMAPAVAIGRLVACVLWLAAAAPAFAQGADRAADEAAIRAVIQAFLDTRERNDAAGLAALLTAVLRSLRLAASRAACVADKASSRASAFFRFSRWRCRVCSRLNSSPYA